MFSSSQGSGSVDWFWEGNVQALLAAHLSSQGWEIISTADTAARAPGVDILAGKSGRVLAIEVKGYPSAVYAAGPKRGQPKPTQPATQSRHWFSQAILSSILMDDKEPGAETWIAFPDFPSYRSLIDRVTSSLVAVGIGVFLIKEEGKVLEIVGSTLRVA